MKEVLRNLIIAALAFVCFGIPALAEDFHVLVREGRLQKVRSELHRDSRLAGIKDGLGRTPLHIAAEQGDLRIVNVLINAGCKVNEIDFLKGYTALHYAALYNHNKIIRFLLSRNANLSIQDTDGNFPLHFSSANGCVDAVKTLIEHQADPNCMNRFWQSPLHMVALGKLNRELFPFASLKEDVYLQVAKILLENGAYSTLRDVFLDTPETIVVKHFKDNPFAQGLIKLIIDHGI